MHCRGRGMKILGIAGAGLLAAFSVSSAVADDHRTTERSYWTWSDASSRASIGNDFSRFNFTGFLGSTSTFTSWTVLTYKSQFGSTSFRTNFDISSIKMGSHDTLPCAGSCHSFNSNLSIVQGALNVISGRYETLVFGGVVFSGTAADLTHTNTNEAGQGFTFGVGAAVNFTDFWSARLEYRHLQSDSQRCSFMCGGILPEKAKVSSDIVSARLSIKFGETAAYLTPRSESNVSDWDEVPRPRTPSNPTRPIR